MNDKRFVYSRIENLILILLAYLLLSGCGDSPEPEDGPENLPNLVVYSASLDPPTFKEGTQVTLNYVIKNEGSAKAEPRPAWSITTSDQGSRHIAPGAPGTSLEPGATTSSIYRHVWVPQCNSTISIIIDPGDQIKEINETDNTYDIKIDNTVCEDDPMLAPEVTAFYDDCLKRINKLRALENLPALIMDSDHQACSNIDAKINFEQGDPHASMCGLTQNTCPPYSSLNLVLDDCIEQQMYINEKVCYQNNPSGCYSDPQCGCGHYVNMTDKKCTKLSCGIYITPSNEYYVVINFFK